MRFQILPVSWLRAVRVRKPMALTSSRIALRCLSRTLAMITSIPSEKLRICRFRKSSRSWRRFGRIFEIVSIRWQFPNHRKTYWIGGVREVNRHQIACLPSFPSGGHDIPPSSSRRGSFGFDNQDARAAKFAGAQLG